MKAATRTVVRRWMAAGSTGVVLAGSLVLSTPAATAAEGDPACVQASEQFTTALGAAGISEAYMAQLTEAVTGVGVAATNYATVLGATDEQSLQAVGTAFGEWVAAQVRLETATAALATAQASGDPVAAASAQDEVTAAQAAADAAAATVAQLEATYVPATPTAEIAAAEQQLTIAAGVLEQLLGQLSIDEATATQLVGLLQASVTACNSTPAGLPLPTLPGVTAPVPAAPVDVAPAPVVPAPVAPVEAVPAPVVPVAPVEAAPAPVAVNEGLNVDTAVAAEHHDRPGTAVLAALLTTGIAAAAITVLITRRLRGAQA